MMNGKVEIMMNKTNQIMDELRKVIVGKDDILIKVYMAIISKGHVLLEDVPGVGKTTLALAFSKVLGLDYKRIQFTSDSVPSDIIGFSLYDKSMNDFKYQEGAAMTNFLLADEINRTSSKTQAALLEVMEERQITVDGITHPVPSPFVVIATQNPVGSAGTQMLPASQLDRFMIKLKMGYPDFKSQVNILKHRHSTNPIDYINPVITRDELIEIQQAVAMVNVEDPIYEYITRMVEMTRSHNSVELGVSPRGSLSICNMTKAHAYIQGRDYVIPEDVQAVFSDVSKHRLIMKQKARIAGVDSLTVVNEILSNIERPAIGTGIGNKSC